MMTSLGYLKGPRAAVGSSDAESGKVQMVCKSSGHQAAKRVRDKGQQGREGAKSTAGVLEEGQLLRIIYLHDLPSFSFCM